MLTAIQRKSLAELTRRKSRSAFAVLTLALAVASVGLLAMPTLIDRSMRTEVASGKLADLTVSTNQLVLGRDGLGQLSALPNVTAVEPGSFFATRVYVGARRAQAYVVGVPDFRRQAADVVHVSSGTAPGSGQVLTEAQNANQGLSTAGTGDFVRIIGADGAVRRLQISGVGRNLTGGQDVTGDGVVVLYATTATVADLSGQAGYSSFAFRLHQTNAAAVAATVAAVRAELRGVPGFSGFTELPVVRAAGDWPGKSDFNTMIDFFYVITVLALLSALVLISNTMTTLVAEQTLEIGVMKAIGGRRRQIGLVYVRTALILGAFGSIVGVVLGVALSNLLVRYLGSTFFAIDVGVGIDPTVVAASLAVGLLGPALAALPAIRRGVRVDLREALQTTGSATARIDAGDRLLRRVRFLPRTAQLGLRGLGRRPRRSVATAVMVGLAVGNLLAVLGVAVAISNTGHGQWRDHGEDVKVDSLGTRPLDARAARLMRTTPGVAAVEPMFTADVRIAGEDAVVWSMRQATVFHHHVTDGRWFTPREERAHARVAVFEQNLARITGARLGADIRMQTAAGPAVVRVIGIASNQQEEAGALFVPITTMRSILGPGPASASDYWVMTTAHDHAFVDRTTTRLEDRLTAAGYTVGTEVEYVEEANDVASYLTFTTIIAVIGFLIVAISMVGLADAMTMSMIERTREIGILRCVGARARDVRRIFATEGVVLAVFGWLIGIPLGYLLDRFLVWLVKEVVNVDLQFAFPALNVVLALAGTVILAQLIILVSVRRAVRVKPGDALRYA